jgi:hypothetical protein
MSTIHSKIWRHIAIATLLLAIPGPMGWDRLPATNFAKLRAKNTAKELEERREYRLWQLARRDWRC